MGPSVMPIDEIRWSLVKNNAQRRRGRAPGASRIALLLLLLVAIEVNIKGFAQASPDPANVRGAYVEGGFDVRDYTRRLRAAGDFRASHWLSILVPIRDGACLAPTVLNAIGIASADVASGVSRSFATGPASPLGMVARARPISLCGFSVVSSCKERRNNLDGITMT